MSNLTASEAANVLIGLKNDLFRSIGQPLVINQKKTELDALRCRALTQAIDILKEVDRGFYSRNTETVF